MPLFKSTKPKSGKNHTAEMTFWEHLGELRSRLFRMALAWIVMSVVAFNYRELIFDKVILAPKDNQFITYRLLCRLGDWLHVPNLCLPPMKLQLISYNLTGQFVTHITISMFAGVVLAAPIILWQLWRFIQPALKPQEKKYAGAAILIMLFLFIIGVLFSYFVMVPWTINFLGGYQVSDLVLNQISLTSYISTFTSTVLSVGLVFELPVVVYVLAKLGIITASFLKSTRKYALIIILIVAAIITPPDVFSQIIVTLPLYGLFELSIMVASRVEPSREPIS